MLNKYHHNHVTARRNIRTGAIALALMPVLLAGCTNPPPEAAAPRTPEPVVSRTPEPVASETPPVASRTPENVTTQEVANKTNQLIGQTVTVRSEPVRKVDAHSFTIRDEQRFGNETILVVNATGAPFVIPTNNMEVQVTGKVAKFAIADINREYNLGLQPSFYVAYESKPVIIAQSLALAPKPGTVTRYPNLFYGKTIAVPGEVANVEYRNKPVLITNSVFPSATPAAQ